MGYTYNKKDIKLVKQAAYKDMETQQTYFKNIVSQINTITSSSSKGDTVDNTKALLNSVNVIINSMDTYSNYYKSGFKNMQSSFSSNLGEFNIDSVDEDGINTKIRKLENQKRQIISSIDEINAINESNKSTDSKAALTNIVSLNSQAQLIDPMIERYKKILVAFQNFYSGGSSFFSNAREMSVNITNTINSLSDVVVGYNGTYNIDALNNNASYQYLQLIEKGMNPQGIKNLNNLGYNNKDINQIMDNLKPGDEKNMFLALSDENYPKAALYDLSKMSATAKLVVSDYFIIVNDKAYAKKENARGQVSYEVNAEGMARLEKLINAYLNSQTEPKNRKLSDKELEYVSLETHMYKNSVHCKNLETILATCKLQAQMKFAEITNGESKDYNGLDKINNLNSLLTANLLYGSLCAKSSLQMGTKMYGLSLNSEGHYTFGLARRTQAYTETNGKYKWEKLPELSNMSSYVEENITQADIKKYEEGMKKLDNTYEEVISDLFVSVFKDCADIGISQVPYIGAVYSFAKTVLSIDYDSITTSGDKEKIRKKIQKEMKDKEEKLEDDLITSLFGKYEHSYITGYGSNEHVATQTLYNSELAKYICDIKENGIRTSYFINNQQRSYTDNYINSMTDDDWAKTELTTSEIEKVKKVWFGGYEEYNSVLGGNVDEYENIITWITSINIDNKNDDKKNIEFK